MVEIFNNQIALSRQYAMQGNTEMAWVHRNIAKITDSDQFLRKEPIGNKIGNWAETILKLASIFAAISGALITLKII